MEQAKLLQETLKTQGQSLTNPRQAVFTALQGEHPLSMHELVARCGSVNRASVYRTIDLFEKLGITQRLQTGWKYKLELSDKFQTHHHHATCLVCGQSLIVPEDHTIEQHLQRMAKEIGFQLERHQLELQGYCIPCQKLLKD